MAVTFTSNPLASEEIKTWVARFKGSEVVAETNKRIVIKCPDLVIARNLARQIKHIGYHPDVQKGVRSNAGYIQAWF